MQSTDSRKNNYKTNKMQIEMDQNRYIIIKTKNWKIQVEYYFLSAIFKTTINDSFSEIKIYPTEAHLS